MKNIKHVFFLSLLAISQLFAGNEDRAGQAGATEILINPWARSSGWGDASTANATGLEAMHLNVAGIAFTQKTELLFSHTNWLQGSGVSINALGFTQKIGDFGAIGMSAVVMNFGDIDITTVNQPEGTGGVYTPTLSTVGVSYAHIFSNSIYAGLTVKVISEALADLNATGVAFDAGIQYVAGAFDQVKFGITLKNVGPTMAFAGDGMSFRGTVSTSGTELTAQHRSQEYELPSLVKIAASYDFKFGELHRLTTAATFTSNSFSNDQYHVGMEYAIKELFVLRGGYIFESGMYTATNFTNIHTGPTAGFSFDVPYNKNGGKFILDYSYRLSSVYNGTHAIGAKLNL